MTPRPHRPRGGLGQHHHGSHHDVESPVENLGARVLEPRREAIPRVVDEQVDRPLLLGDPGNDALQVASLAQVSGKNLSLHSSLLC